MLTRYLSFSIIAFVLIVSGCSGDSNTSTPPNTTTPAPKKEVKIPKFNRDSAYVFTQKQVDFGPRVPNTKTHIQTKDWLVEKFKSFGADVIEQNFQVKSFKNQTLNSTNIIAQYNVTNPKRVVLAAHWDTRHKAEQDKDEKKKEQPILGADDGASGVGMLLEIARQIQANGIDLGVDIVLFDAEDQGENGGAETTWCLGSQHWSRVPHKPGYDAKWGILLDMAGAKNARFTKDETSMKHASKIMNKVWKIAKDRGYGNYFVDELTGPLVDDHKFVNEIAGIPMIDIINRPQTSRTGFGAYWHTHDDDMSVINKNTLRAVGQTVLAAIYREAAGTF